MDNNEKEFNNMDNRDSNFGIIAEVIETKLDQLIESVREIKDQMHDNSVDIANLKLQNTSLENKIESQEEKIKELKKHYEVNKNMIMGVAMTVVASIAVAIIKVVASSL